MSCRKALTGKPAGLLAALLGLLVCCARSVAEAERKDYGELILRATGYIYRGRGPSKDEMARAEAAMKELEKDKDAVTKYVVAAIANGDATKPAGQPAPDTGQYGHVLWHFGGKYVKALEPDVLNHPSPRVRRSGAYILGGGYNRPDAEEAVNLLVKVLRRDEDPSVQAEAIHALDNQRAKDRYTEVQKFLKSQHAEPRRAAVGFISSMAPDGGLPDLKAMLEKETDRAAGFLLAAAFTRYKAFDYASLLKNGQPGIRQGALYQYGQPVNDQRLGADGWKAALPLLETEEDPVCRLELGYLLVWRGRSEGIPLLLEALHRAEPPKDGTMTFSLVGGNRYEQSYVYSALLRLTGLKLELTEEDGKRARSGLSSLRYARVAGLLDQWWEDHKGRLAWDKTEHKFVPGQGK